MGPLNYYSLSKSDLYINKWRRRVLRTLEGRTLEIQRVEVSNPTTRAAGTRGCANKEATLDRESFSIRQAVAHRRVGKQSRLKISNSSKAHRSRQHRKPAKKGRRNCRKRTIGDFCRR